MRNYFAMSMTKFFRFMADTFFAKRYGHRAVVLETVAGVPGMVAGMMLHFKSLRKMKTGYGPDIREMLAEAENERMHLMTFIEIAKPSKFERFLILLAQIFFGIFYTFIYIFFKKTAKLSDLIIKVRADEMHHSEVNHKYADGDTSFRRKNG